MLQVGMKLLFISLALVKMKTRDFAWLYLHANGHNFFGIVNTSELTATIIILPSEAQTTTSNNCAKSNEPSNSINSERNDAKSSLLLFE